MCIYFVQKMKPKYVRFLCIYFLSAYTCQEESFQGSNIIFYLYILYNYNFIYIVFICYLCLFVILIFRVITTFVIYFKSELLIIGSTIVQGKSSRDRISHIVSKCAKHLIIRCKRGTNCGRTS